MQRAIRTKQPGEVRTLTFDFTEKLSIGDALTGGGTATISNETAPSTPALTGSNITRSGNLVTIRLTAGGDGADWNVQMACGTVNGDTLQMDALMQIRDKVN